MYPKGTNTILRPEFGMSFHEFDAFSNDQGFISLKVLTPIEVGVAANQFGKIPVEEILKDVNTYRNPDGSYNERVVKMETGSYATRERGIVGRVDQNLRRTLIHYGDAAEIAVTAVRSDMARSMELEAVAMLTDVTGTPGVSAFANAELTQNMGVANQTPIADIDGAIASVRALGVMPNVVVMNWITFRKFMRSPDVTELVKYSGIDDPKLLRNMESAKRVAAAILGVDEVLVAGVTRNTANEGPAPTLAPVWPDNTIGVYVVDRSANFQLPCVGRTFIWSEDGGSTEFGIESDFDWNTRSEKFRSRFQIDQKVISYKAGYVLTPKL
jgi:hypothetical protein